jgi:CHRD domain
VCVCWCVGLVCFLFCFFFLDEGLIFVTPERVRPAISQDDLPTTQGSGEVEFNDATNTIKLTITHDIPADQTLTTSAVHLHLGTAEDDDAGGVIVLLSESGASPIAGSGVIPDENVEDVLQGRTYVCYG